MDQHREPDRAGSFAAQLAASRLTLVAVLVAILLGIITAYALKITYSVSMPLALAFFLAAAVHPVQAGLAARLPPGLRGLGLLAALAVVVLALAALVGAVWLAGELVAPKMPEYADQLRQQWQSLKGWARQVGLPLPMAGGDAEAEQSTNGNLIETLTGTLQDFASSFVSFLVLLVLTLFFMLLMLGEAHRWGEKAVNALPGGAGLKAVDVVRTVAFKVRRFLLVRTVASLISGVVAGVWLWLVGVDLALVWGLLFFVLNYIPNIGSVIAAIPPTLVALLQLGPAWAAVAVAGLVANEQIIGNYVDPKLQGRNLDVSPLVILVSVIFWGWVWGIVGALIAVPMTVTLLIAFSRTEALRPLALLLSSSPDFEQMDQRANRH